MPSALPTTTRPHSGPSMFYLASSPYVHAQRRPADGQLHDWDREQRQKRVLGARHVPEDSGWQVQADGSVKCPHVSDTMYTSADTGADGQVLPRKYPAHALQASPRGRITSADSWRSHVGPKVSEIRHQAR